MNGAGRVNHSISGLFAFLLIGLFALTSLAIVVSGIKSYRGMADGARFSSQQRLALGYVSGKLRASGDRDSVTIRFEQGISLLSIMEEADGTSYETRIYFANGVLREQFCQPDLPFDPEDGDQIASLPGFTFERAGDLITLRAHLSDGTEADTCIALRAGEGGGQDAL
jgi:hypothetical protein